MRFFVKKNCNFQLQNHLLYACTNVRNIQFHRIQKLCLLLPSIKKAKRFANSLFDNIGPLRLRNVHSPFVLN